MAATIACAQQDIKKVLAYSTVSQLGYMFLAVGCGAYEAAIFLMVAHAFFKGLLFLGAGSVIHGLHDEQDLKRMGNLRRYMPHHLHHLRHRLAGHRRRARRCRASGPRVTSSRTPGPPTRPCGSSGSSPPLLTAYYMSRLTGLAFFGERPLADEVAIDAATDMPDAHHAEGAIPEPHESPWVMTVPLVVLAFFAAVGRRAGPAQTLHLSLSHCGRPGVRRRTSTTTT